MNIKSDLISLKTATQQAHEADHAIESLIEAVFACVASQIKFGHTAQPAWRLMRHPLVRLITTWG